MKKNISSTYYIYIYKIQKGKIQLYTLERESKLVITI